MHLLSLCEYSNKEDLYKAFRESDCPAFKRILMFLPWGDEAKGKKIYEKSVFDNKSSFFFGIMGLSHTPISLTAYKNLEIERVANVASFESNESNAVEVKGIRFETLIPERVLKLPSKKRGINTPVQLGIGITNNTQKLLHFSFYCTLTPELMTADGKTLQAGYFSDAFVFPKESDFPLIIPGECVTFFPYTKLVWLECERFGLIIAAGDGGFWTFRMQLDIYQFKFRYRKLNSLRANISAEWDTIEPRLSERVWLGLVDTPVVELHLVQP